jgi:thiaminase/transcriptional activator TenA
MTADALMSRHTAAWRGATVHPFLEGVPDGPLPEHSFDRWLAQDYLFAQALGLEPAINGLTILRS